VNSYRGRFAPSPTGDLHLGGASTALVAWLAARAANGTLIMRVEDIDSPRVRAGSEQRILEDLHWLGFDWDEGPGSPTGAGPAAPYHQSQRTELYLSALEQLEANGLIYPCDCSRKEIASVASAPHLGEEGPLYPGTCRPDAGPAPRSFRRPPATRLALPDHTVEEFVDRIHGTQKVDLKGQVGDFVLRRGDGVFSYQLAVTVDDITQGVTEVVRGADLLSSTARQLFLCRSLGAESPTYAHAPVVVGPDGERLAKRARGVPIRDQREAGVDPQVIVAYLARALGLAGPEEVQLWPSDLVDRFSWDRIPRGPIMLDPCLFW
jgi:glutamyl-tRNA synthetase